MLGLESTPLEAEVGDMFLVRTDGPLPRDRERSSQGTGEPALAGTIEFQLHTLVARSPASGSLYSYDHASAFVARPDCLGSIKSRIQARRLKAGRYLRPPVGLAFEEYMLWSAQFPPPVIARISRVASVEEARTGELLHFIYSIQLPEILFGLEFGLRDGSFVLILMKGRETEEE